MRTLDVWIPESFPLNFREHIQKNGSQVILTKGRQQIIPGAFTTGIIEGWIKEQSLVLESSQGLIIMTGCAHPRIINIIHTVAKQWDQNIYMALGGFHLTGFSDHEILEIISEFQNFNIKKAGPCHCSGKDARRLFHEIYEENYVHIDVGTTISIP
jgi:7,8-dihydropterin-6-yl-methyl-4-(beta-D-ribofuranosyl)aminobenzene 5'-phosphate synthase